MQIAYSFSSEIESKSEYNKKRLQHLKLNFLLFQQTYLEHVTTPKQNIIAQIKHTLMKVLLAQKSLQESRNNVHIHLEWILFGQLLAINLLLLTVLK